MNTKIKTWKPARFLGTAGVSLKYLLSESKVHRSLLMWSKGGVPESGFWGIKRILEHSSKPPSFPPYKFDCKGGMLGLSQSSSLCSSAHMSEGLWDGPWCCSLNHMPQLQRVWLLISEEWILPWTVLLCNYNVLIGNHDKLKFWQINTNKNKEGKVSVTTVGSCG